MEKLEKIQSCYHESIGYYKTDHNLVTKELAFSRNFKTAHETY